MPEPMSLDVAMEPSWPGCSPACSGSPLNGKGKLGRIDPQG